MFSRGVGVAWGGGVSTHGQPLHRSRHIHNAAYVHGFPRDASATSTSTTTYCAAIWPPSPDASAHSVNQPQSTRRHPHDQLRVAHAGLGAGPVDLHINPPLLLLLLRSAESSGRSTLSRIRSASPGLPETTTARRSHRPECCRPPQAPAPGPVYSHPLTAFQRDLATRPVLDGLPQRICLFVGVFIGGHTEGHAVWTLFLAVESGSFFSGCCQRMPHRAIRTEHEQMRQLVRVEN